MRRVVITQAAPVTALGDGLDPLWDGLLAGQSGIAPLTRFSCDNYISHYGACVDNLDAPVGTSLLDSLLERVAAQMGELPADCRLLVASTKGEIDLLTTARREGKTLSEGMLFETLIAKVAHRFGLNTTGYNINAACASSTLAVTRAAAMISAGVTDAVLVYAADLVSEFVFSGFSALQALSDSPCRPFDCQRNGLTLGEAGGALLLTAEDSVATDNDTPLAIVAGWGVANDAHHVTAPARDGCGLILACQQALTQAALEPAAIAAINAHGTGTVYNDAMELTAFGELFGPSLPPLHGVKGSIGHCLGAAGGVEIAVACRSLAQQQIPGTVGGVNPEPAAHGKLGEKCQPLCGDYLLCTNSGFGGINAAVILQGVE